MSLEEPAGWEDEDYQDGPLCDDCLRLATYDDATLDYGQNLAAHDAWASSR